LTKPALQPVGHPARTVVLATAEPGNIEFPAGRGYLAIIARYTAPGLGPVTVESNRAE
jgi:hypothetical protein